MTTAAIAYIIATMSHDHIDARGLAVHPSVFARLCAESSLPKGHGLGSLDELHITTSTDDAAALDALDDELRARAQTVSDFVGAECVALFPRQGIDGCDVWARCRVEEIVVD